MKQLRGDDGGLLRDSVAARDELERAKARVAESPERVELRLELAEAYRARGFPDQAGRWGILTEGWPTDIELDRFARMLADPKIDAVGIRRILMLDEAAPLPPLVTALMNGRVKAHRAARSSFGTALERTLEVATLLAFCTFLGTLLLVFLIAAVGVGEPTEVARVGGITTGVLVLIAVAAGLLSARASRAASK